MQLGGILSALVAIALVERYGWASAYYFGSLPILLVPVLILYLPEAPWMLVLNRRWSKLRKVLAELRPELGPQSVAADAEFVYPKSQEKPSLAEVFAEGRALSTVLFWTVYFMNILAIYGTNTWIPKLMMNAGHSIQDSLTIYLALFVGALVASPVLGHLADRLGSKKICIFSYLGGFAFILLLAAPMNLPLSILTVAMVGICTQGAQNVTHAYVAQYFPPAVKSTMMGWGLSVGRFGGLLGTARWRLSAQLPRHAAGQLPGLRRALSHIAAGHHVSPGPLRLQRRLRRRFRVQCAVEGQAPRTGCINSPRRPKSSPQGLKPAILLAFSARL